MGDPPWFVRDEAECKALLERLKQIPCPHCKRTGTLNRHGFLHGFDDASPRRKTLRAWRVFCNNRQRCPGCGRTVSIWLADKMRRLSLTTRTLGTFLLLAATTGLAAASNAVDCHLSDRTLQRLWRRFRLGQSQIRTALLTRCPPPQGQANAALQVLAHLHTAFAGADDLIAAFQHSLRTFFL